MEALKELYVLDDLYTEERPSDINLKKLAEWLGVQNKDVAKALDLSPSQMSTKPYAPNSVALKEWMGIFNLIIQTISQANPATPHQEVKLKMQRWLKLARPEFGNKTPLEYMLQGKSRRVKNLIEQMLD